MAVEIREAQVNASALFVSLLKEGSLELAEAFWLWWADNCCDDDHQVIWEDLWDSASSN